MTSAFSRIDWNQDSAVGPTSACLRDGLSASAALKDRGCGARQLCKTPVPCLILSFNRRNPDSPAGRRTSLAAPRNHSASDNQQGGPRWQLRGLSHGPRIQPPRSLKSICVSVAYVAWLLGHEPTRRVIVASYSGDFAAELHRQFRMVVGSEWYAALFPTLRWAKETGLELITTQGGSRYATSVLGTLTGRGADLIIVDDPLNANEVHSEPARKRVIDWYGGALVSRLNDKQTGSIIAVMQRLHEDDLAGHLIRQGGWDHLDMPAIALENEIIELGHEKSHPRRSGDVLHPERESREALEAIKAEVGSLLFSAQYQQRPVPVEGNLIRRSWFLTYDNPPASSSRTRIVQSWDVAMMTGGQNDYSACTTSDEHQCPANRGGFCFLGPLRLAGDLFAQFVPQGKFVPDLRHASDYFPFVDFGPMFLWLDVTDGPPGITVANDGDRKCRWQFMVLQKLFPYHDFQFVCCFRYFHRGVLCKGIKGKLAGGIRLPFNQPDDGSVRVRGHRV